MGGICFKPRKTTIGENINRQRWIEGSGAVTSVRTPEIITNAKEDNSYFNFTPRKQKGDSVAGNQLLSSPRLGPRKFSISYSHKYSASESEIVKIDVDESLIETVLSKHRGIASSSISTRYSVTRVPSRNKKQVRLNDKSCLHTSENEQPKQVRFNDKVIIHTIEYEQPKTVNAKSETYAIIVTLREIWSRLDLDNDGYLNIVEMKRFCSEVWEETFDVSSVLGFYAKSDPETGMTFYEWCKLVKDEDPHMSEFLDDLYEIFVEQTTADKELAKSNSQ